MLCGGLGKIWAKNEVSKGRDSTTKEPAEGQRGSGVGTGQ